MSRALTLAGSFLVLVAALFVCVFVLAALFWGSAVLVGWWLRIVLEQLR